MNIFKIYQVKEEHLREYGYASMRELLWTHHAERRGDPSTTLRSASLKGLGGYTPPLQDDSIFLLPREAWEPVYTWETEKVPSLDYIFETFNRNYRELGLSCEATPEDFTGHSMSVSDIIEYPDGRLWFCDSLGWKEIVWQSN